MKKALRIFLVLLLALSALLLVACNKNETPETPEEPAPSTPTEKALTFTLLEDGTYEASVGTLNKASEIVIPATYEGKPVTALGSFASATVEKITIPEGITSMVKGVFYNCLFLEEVALPDSLEVLPVDAFEDCINLESVKLPANLKEIGDNAFMNCKKLVTVTLPNTVERLGSQVFFNCTGLTNLTLSDNLRYVGHNAFAVAGEDTWQENSEKGETWLYPHDLVYNELDGDFYLGSASNPRLVLIRPVDRYAVGDYTVHADTKIIYTSAFEGSTLSSVTLHDQVTNIVHAAFYRCTGLKSVHIPDSVTEIGAHAFRYCSYLTAVTGMNQIVALGDYAFANCSRLKNINIGSTLQVLGEGALSISNVITYDEDNIGYLGNAENPYLVAFRALNKSTTEKYTINGRARFIDDNTFSNCSAVKEIYVSDGMEYIGSYAFSSCSKLNYVRLPESLHTVRKYAFYNCPQLSSLIVPKNVTSLGFGIVQGCSAMSRITLPFVGTDSSVLFGSVFGANNTDQHTTRVPKALKEVTITGGTTIGKSAFSDCEYIESLSLPASIKSVSTGAFFFTKALKKIYLEDVSAWCNVTMQTSTCSPFINGASLYKGTKKVEELTIPDTVTEVKAFVFQGCTSFTSLTFSDTVLSVGDDSFKDCVNVATITLGKNTTQVLSSAFENCAALTTITMSPVLEVLDSSALRGCVLLTEITLPETMRFIGDHAFKNCDALEKVKFEGKSGWGTTDNRGATEGEPINVWFKSKNAENLTDKFAEAYWVRKTD